MVTATVEIVQWDCVVCGFYLVKTTVHTMQYFCVFCVVNCSNSNISYRAMVLCFVWSLLWLQQQYI